MTSAVALSNVVFSLVDCVFVNNTALGSVDTFDDESAQLELSGGAVLFSLSSAAEDIQAANVTVEVQVRASGLQRPKALVVCDAQALPPELESSNYFSMRAPCVLCHWHTLIRRVAPFVETVPQNLAVQSELRLPCRS